jgi:subtilisin family serine protease
MEEIKRWILPAVFAVAAVSPARAIKVETMTRLTVQGSAEVVEVVSGEGKVLFRSDFPAADRIPSVAAVGATFLQELPATGGWCHVKLPPGLSVSAGLERLKNAKGVSEVAPNHVYRTLKIPNDPRYSSQYYLESINMPAAWEYETGSSSGVTIVIMDAGIQGDHPDLVGKLTGTSQFCDPGSNKNSGADNSACVANNPPTEACNHGTQVAGIAAASTNNGSAVAGVSWGANLMSYKVFRDGDCLTDCSNNGANACATDDTALINALDHIRTNVNNNPARAVVNISIGGASACDTAVSNSISSATSAGMLVIVSAGNDGGAVNNPANCPDSIPVGATTENDSVASFSSRGTELAANGVVAPGVNLVTTDTGGSVTGSATGTSFSAPIVAGLAALVLSKSPALTPAQVKTNIRSGAVGIGVAGLGAQSGARVPFGSSTGAGRVNAFRTMKLTAEGTLAGFEGDEKVIAFPNPFRPSQHGAATITIPTGLQSTGAQIRVYTMAGEIVRDLGAKTSWDGKNDGGNEVATGVYILLVKTDAGTQKARLAVIR